MHELDRVLDRQDVPVLAVVDMIDHGRERGRFSRSGRAGHKYHPARVIRDLREDPGALQVFERQDVGGDGTKYRARSPIVVEGVDAEARETRDLEGEVALQELLVVLALLVVHDVVDERMDLFVFQGWDIDARTSPSTRIMGGRPAESCRSEARS